jgi:AcrR family transcriptional regulator
MVYSSLMSTKAHTPTTKLRTQLLRMSTAVPRAVKGAQTKQSIVDTALRLASQSGLEGLSIGVLAEAMDMSKSGVFAHFGSREELQISVIRGYHERFEQEVFYPALQQPRGLPRLRTLFERWVKRVSLEVDQGCIYISGAVEFDDRPGPVRDALVEMVRTWHSAMLKAVEQARAEKHLHSHTDAQQLLFEIHGLILALHHDARFMRTPGSIDRAIKGFERLISDTTTRNPTKAAVRKKTA